MNAVHTLFMYKNLNACTADVYVSDCRANVKKKKRKNFEFSRSAFFLLFLQLIHAFK